MIALYAITTLLFLRPMTILAYESLTNSESVFLCDGVKYVSPMILNYEYRLKIAPGFEIHGIVSDLESVLIKKLKSFMMCEPAAEEVKTFLEDEKPGDLGVVGLKSSPDDKIQPNCKLQPGHVSPVLYHH